MASQIDRLVTGMYIKQDVIESRESYQRSKSCKTGVTSGMLTKVKSSKVKSESRNKTVRQFSAKKLNGAETEPFLKRVRESKSWLQVKCVQ